MPDRRDTTTNDRFDADNPPAVPGGISRASMQSLPFALALSDARLDDYPLIYVNSAFERMTGYPAEAIMGRNCRFLQGKDTSPETVDKIRIAISEEREVSIDIINYRADGTPFANRLLISPLKDDDGTTTHFLGIQTEPPDDANFAQRVRELDESLREVQHRVKNHLSMLLALIRLEAKRATDPQASLNVLANRVEALNVLYENFADGGVGGAGTIGLGAYISRVCSALNMLDGQREVRVNIDTDAFDATVDAASHVGLLVSELLTNALQHAFEGDEKGEITVRLWDHDEDTLCLRVADNGRGLPEGSTWPQEGNLGSRIVRDLSSRLDAKLEVDSAKTGTSIHIAIPKTSLLPRD
ncbi:MAG: PAS domain-containing protein [Erythrobacter sp.]